jgi:hypothetical protein
MMVADYLESIGVMTRIYMTRFVVLGLTNRTTDYTLRKETQTGVELPMYKVAPRPTFKTSLLVQPIIAKEFGQEFDKSIGFMVSSDNQQEVYKKLATWAIEKEVVEFIRPYGEPRWQQNDYFEGIERYRNKYQEYVKLGLFKSKEVLPEAMMFFHDIPIKTYLSEFCQKVMNYTNKGKAEALIDININPFFNWWMRLSATTLKNKVDIVNSRELRKDLEAIKVELGNFIVELKDIVLKANPNLEYNGVLLSEFFKNMGNSILGVNNGYSIIDRRQDFSFKKYIQNITLEITTYAEGLFFETEDDRKEIREELYENVEKELVNF